jgi:hypothetical protein
MLDTIRLLTRNVKLKELIIANFIPDETAKSIERRAVWKEEEDMWLVPVHKPPPHPLHQLID